MARFGRWVGNGDVTRKGRFSRLYWLPARWFGSLSRPDEGRVREGAFPTTPVLEGRGHELSGFVARGYITLSTLGLYMGTDCLALKPPP